MKITRTARFRREGTKVLFEDKPLEPKAWSFDARALTIGKVMVGKDRGNNYKYFVDFTVPELLSAIETTLDATTKTRAEKAVAASSISALRELLLAEPSDETAKP